MFELLRGHLAYQLRAQAEREFLTRLTSHTQSPGALFVGCSDSRVIPELLTSSAPGELFVVRNVANVVPTFEHADASVGAAIEYAVGALQVQHIVVCGHTRCGGVHAMIHPEHAPTGLPSLAEWLSAPTDALHAHARLHDDHADPWRHAVERNAILQLRNLATYPIIAQALTTGRLDLHAWIYDLTDGSVAVYDADADRFVGAREVIQDGRVSTAPLPG